LDYMQQVKPLNILVRLITKHLALGVAALLIGAFLVSSAAAGALEEQGVQEEETPEEVFPGVSSNAAVLMDRETRRVLYAKNAERRRPMASTTKIMTALVALEEGKLQEKVTVSQEAASMSGSSVYLEEGEEKTLEELLYGLLLRSGNDAAVAIAEHVGGSVEEFSRIMTRRARDLGAKNTSFKNPHGLHHEEHYTTAYDMALITSHALENEVFSRIASSPWAVITWPGQQWDRVLRNQNLLLGRYEGADGVKTGWTTPAGRCFVGSATRAEWQLVAVVLNAPQMWEDTEVLLDYGYQSFSRQRLIRRGQVLKSVKLDRARVDFGKVAAEEDFYYPLQPGEEKEVRYLFRLSEPVEAPIAAGQVLGKLDIRLGEEDLGGVNLVAAEDIERSPFYYFLVKLYRKHFS